LDSRSWTPWWDRSMGPSPSGRTMEPSVPCVSCPADRDSRSPAHRSFPERRRFRRTVVYLRRPPRLPVSGHCAMLPS
jgi:hypothetical protein